MVFGGWLWRCCVGLENGCANVRCVGRGIVVDVLARLVYVGIGMIGCYVGRRIDCDSGRAGCVVSGSVVVLLRVKIGLVF